MAIAGAAARKHMDLGYEASDVVSSDDAKGAPTVSGLRVAFHDVARFPAPGDNCAIVTRFLEAGTVIELPEDGRAVRLDYSMLEGHRFAVRDIPEGELLLSWGSGFGRAIEPIRAGAFVVGLDEAATRLG